MDPIEVSKLVLLLLLSAAIGDLVALETSGLSVSETQQIIPRS
jgi:hypothetical protein